MNAPSPTAAPPLGSVRQDETPSRPGRVSARFPALQRANFRRYALGQGLSTGGTWLQNVALAWLVLELTSSGKIIGLVGAAQFLPPVILGAWAGAVTERLDSRRAVMYLQIALCGQASALAVLVFTHSARVWSLLLLALLQGILSAFDPPLRQGLMNEVVGDHELTNAIAINSALVHLGGILGPSLAALLISTVGTPWCFVVNAASYAVMFWAIASIRPEDLHARPRTDGGAGSLKAGFAYLWARTDLRVLMGLVAFSSLVAVRLEVILPVLAKRDFHGGSRLFSWLNVARGIGALSSSLYLASRRRPPTMRMLRVAAVLLGTSMAFIALPGFFGLSRHVVALVALVPAGAGTMMLMVPTLSMTQLIVEPRFRSRLVAIWFVVMNAGTVIGAPLTGWVCDTFGTRTALLLSTLSMLVVSVVITHFASSVVVRPLAPIPAALHDPPTFDPPGA